MTAVPARLQSRGSKLPQDTIAGCRCRADSDLLASVAMLTANQRLRLETSAASWTARADMLQRLDDTHLARKLALKRSANGETEASPIRL
jgi:hypothetical protein